MKTVGELRKAILDAGGEIKIGLFRFEHRSITDDIDIYFNGKLLHWYRSSVGESVPLTESDEISTNNDSIPADQSDKIDELEKSLTDAKTKISSLEKDLEQNQLALGKVEAYEKLLIGRDLTISK